VFTTALHWSLSWARLIPSHPPHPISLRSILILSTHLRRACGSVVGWGNMLQTGRSRVQFPRRSLDFLIWPKTSSRTMALRSTQSLTEMSIRHLPGGKERSARKADNFTAICKPTVWKIWEPRGLTTLRAFMACYRDCFTFYHPPISWSSCSKSWILENKCKKSILNLFKKKLIADSIRGNPATTDQFRGFTCSFVQASASFSSSKGCMRNRPDENIRT
jgi:hypothetical protein